MADMVNTPEELDQEGLIKLLFDMAHRLMVHHTLWFEEIKHQMGREAAYQAIENVFKKSFPAQMKRMGKALNYELKDGIPAALLEMPRENLLGLLDSIALNWLTNDGIWFQEIEFSEGMNDAKRCNDSCWAHFSPFEARSIKALLQLPTEPGLEGLKKALNFRLYGRINRQSFSEETAEGFVFQMNECRVQQARQRKGLDDYPCKSVGLVEYPYFARAVDHRIRTECLGCPPDPHPVDWFCAWRFSLSTMD